MTSKGYKPLSEPGSRANPHGIRSWLRRGYSLEPRQYSSSEKPLLNQDVKYEAQWGIHWQTPVSIIGLLMIGLGSGVCHHLFYAYLDGSSAESAINQQLATRIGTAFAFLVKTTLVAAIGISRKQLIWYALRRRPITLAGIDGLFGVSSDPTQFANLDMILNAPFSTLMAIVMWTIPLSSIVAPGSLSITPGTVHVYNATCKVPTTRYPFDRNSSAVLRNQPDAKSLVSSPLGSYSSPSHDAIAGYEAMVYGWGSLISNETFEGCPPSADCTYSLSTMLSGLRCTSQDWFVQSESEILSPIDTDKYRNLTQNLTRTQGMYLVFYAERLSSGDGYDTLGILHTRRISENSTDFNLTISECVNAIARFQFNISYSKGYLDLKTHGPEDLAPVTASLVGDATSPDEYDTTLALMDGAIGMLEGKIEALASGATLSTENTKIRLFTGQTPVGNVSSEELLMIIQKASIHMAILPMVFADIEYRAYIETRCDYINYVNVYFYNKLNLLSAYLLATVMTVLMVFLGFYALVKNGVASDINFSTIMLTTRNTDLDELAKGSCLGGNPLPKRLREEKMMFGVIKEPTKQEAGHTAIGQMNGKNHVIKLVPGEGRYA